MMKSIWYLCLVVLILTLPNASSADTINRTVSGMTDGGQAVAFDVMIDFTQTGGDFGAGTATATVVITLENVSGLYPYQAPPMGNPMLTAFYFNLPSGATVVYAQASVLAGSVMHSLGTDLAGTWYPAGCTVLGSDEIHTDWYSMYAGSSSGDFGTFSYSLETVSGVLGGIADPDVFSSCTLLGDLYSDLAVTGPVAFTLYLGQLGMPLDMAEDFLALCSVAPGERQTAALAGKFMGTDEYGEDSGIIADIGYCEPVGTQLESWGKIKSMYR